MEYLIRKNPPYLDITVAMDSISVNLGLFDKNECQTLAWEMLGAIEDLVSSEHEEALILIRKARELLS